MPARNEQSTRRLLATFARSAISLTLIALIIWWLGGLGKIAAIVARLNLGLTLAVVTVMIFDRFLMSYKWTLLLKGRGFHLRLLAAMNIYCASMIWGMFLPSTVGADAVRAVSTARAGINRHEVVASIIIERMIGFLCVLLLGLVSLVLLSTTGLLEHRLIGVWWSALAMIVLAIVILVASFSNNVFHLVHDRILGRLQDNRIAAKLRKFHETYQAYRENKGSLSVFFVLTFAEQFVAFTQSWLLTLALGVQVGFLYLIMAIPLSLLIARIPIGIDGLGTYEAPFAFLLSLAGISGAEAVSIALTGRILRTLVLLPWWFAQMTSARSVPPTIEKTYPNPATAEGRIV